VVKAYSMTDFPGLEAWLVTGGQHLYGQDALKLVEQHSASMGAALSLSSRIPVKIVTKPVVTDGESIERLCRDANSSPNCVGLITWMHTFSPARMWIGGLRSLAKPYLHLHTQFNEQLPWATIDMDFMNLNQSAHGDREFGFIASRMRLSRKVVVGSCRDENVHSEIAAWTRAACAWSSTGIPRSRISSMR
jgi:L-arabinose isomerase